MAVAGGNPFSLVFYGITVLVGAICLFVVVFISIILTRRSAGGTGVRLFVDGGGKNLCRCSVAFDHADSVLINIALVVLG